MFIILSPILGVFKMEVVIEVEGIVTQHVAAAWRLGCSAS